jgi:predicted transcriptional regulator
MTPPLLVDCVLDSLHTGSMELNVPSDLQTKLARAADRRGIAAEALVLEAIERAVEYDEWFLREIEKGFAQIERGEVLTHEEVGIRIERRLTEKPHRLP